MQKASMTAEAPFVLTAREGAAGVIRLSRPKALNALTLPMVRLIRTALEDFLADPAIALIILEAAEGRAFCAGGDIRACAVSGRAGDGVAEAFWREEYELISRLAASEKPVVALLDGIVMGGGAGLAMHLQHRVVTEKVRFAMPEVGIGFIPDVGASFLLPRLPGAVGRYLALTGESIAVGDMLAAGLADHGVPSQDLPALRQALIEAAGSATDMTISAVIARFAVPMAPDLFARGGPLIARAFGAQNLRGTIEILRAVPPGDPDAAFATETIAVIDSRSPFSLAVTAELLRLGAGAERMEECLLREFRAACFCLTVRDFYEGVRAAVIDKDRRPHWPSRAEGAVLPTMDAVFASRPGNADPDFV
jgi:enoyl-CoA hydratase